MKLNAFTPPTSSQAATEAGLPPQTIPVLLEKYSANITAVPGMNTTIETAVEGAVVQAATNAFR